MASQGDNSEGYSSIEIEDSSTSRLVTSVRGMIDAVPPISLDCCIYRAPQGVRQLNEKAYTPQRVSIGPLHHGKENLLPMEEQKLRYLSAFLDRTKLSLEDCIRFVSGLEQRVRDCYLESVNLSSDEFVKMILVDSSFIIEVIWRTYYQMPENNMDYLSNRISRVDVVRRDMILLENQIPHFVTAGLFNLASPKTGELSFIGLSIHYFGCVSLLNHISQRAQKISESKVQHFVDLLRLCHLPSTLRTLPRNRVEFVMIPTARDLQEVGVSIRKEWSNNILDIQYAKGVLKIPQFEVQDDSEIVLRNLIAFEICHCEDSYIIDYVIFMDILLSTGQDVDILVQNEILKNSLLDSASVITLFHDLTSQVLWSENYYYHGLCKKVNSHCRVPWNKWKAVMKCDYFSTPWSIVSTVAAVILLVLTLIQTVCSVISILQ